jgi:hypothetical protein
VYSITILELKVLACLKFIAGFRNSLAAVTRGYADINQMNSVFCFSSAILNPDSLTKTGRLDPEVPDFATHIGLGALELLRVFGSNRKFGQIDYKSFSARLENQKVELKDMDYEIWLVDNNWVNSNDKNRIDVQSGLGRFESNSPRNC